MSYLYQPYKGMLKYPTNMCSYVLKKGTTKQFILRMCKDGSNRKKFRVECSSEADSVRCYVNAEGHLVCERLEPGDYVVKTKNVKYRN